MVKSFQQQMKINESSVWAPRSNGVAHSMVIEGFGQTQPALEVIARPHVIPRKDVEPPKHGKKRVCRGAAPKK